MILLIQQYALGCLFRSEGWTDEDKSERTTTIEKLWMQSGGPMDWRALLDEVFAESGVEGKKAEEREMLRRRVDALMTSLFGTLTKGLIGSDTLVRE